MPNKTLIFILIVLFAVFLFLLFGGRKILFPVEDERDPKSVPFYQAFCQKDSDCVKVAGDTCGCSSGGTATSVNKNFKDQWLESTEWGMNTCLAVISNHPSCFTSPKCENFQCKLK